MLFALGEFGDNEHRFKTVRNKINEIKWKTPPVNLDDI